jgi:hypothetical protein
MKELTKIQLFKKAMGNVDKKIKKMEFPCLYPGCNEAAILSHSQQKEGALRLIAKEGLVYGLRKSMYHIISHIIKGADNLPLTKIGIREASSFKGYCNHHDKEIFVSIEQKPLIVDDAQQAALFCLRAISFEIAAKRKNMLRMKMMWDEIGAYAKDYEDESSLWIEGMKYFLIREAPFIFNQLTDMLTKHNYSNLHVSWARIQQKLPFSLTTSFCPWLDKFAEKWSPDFNKPQAMVALSVIPAMDQTDIICSWLDYCHEDSKWIGEEMATMKGIERIINLLGFSETEDFCINIDFWESQTEEMKALISSNMRHSMFRGPTVKVPTIIKITD